VFAQTQNIKCNVQRAFSFALSLPTIQQSNLAALAWLEETPWKDAMETIEATFKVVTPMFMSGADQSQAELRLPSIKGALRFWWRALAWQRLGNVQAIHAEENYLFGSADQDVGQAAVLMKLTVLEAEDASQKSFDTRRYPGLPYLGYGVMDYNGNVINNNGERSYIPSVTFRLSLLFKPKVPQQHKETVVDALKLFGLIGGLGAKSRKGYGSVTLRQLEHKGEIWYAPTTLGSLQQAITNFKYKNQAPEPPYTALSQASRFVIFEGESDESALSLLDRIGCELMFYRSFGRNGLVLGEEIKPNFRDDHDLMRSVATNSPAHHHPITYPRRVAFGLPHNYYFGSARAKADVKAVDHSDPDSPKPIERRASGLFIHIHHADRYPVAVLSFLPAQFLPASAKIRLSSVPPRRPPTDVDVEHDVWQPVRDLLDRIVNDGSVEPFNNMVMI
jgi:CRISPR-associated protein Cmr1